MEKTNYEGVIVINATLEDAQIEEIIRNIQEFVKANDGEITAFEKWGRKRLAYPIKKAKSGFYLIYRFIAPPDLIYKLERTFRLDENIFRYLTIKLDKKALAHLKKKEQQEAQAKQINSEETSEAKVDKAAK